MSRRVSDSINSESERVRFEELYHAHHKMVRGVLFNMVGDSALDDLVQEAFLRIWKGFPQFSSRSSFKTWIYTITVHTAIDHLRRRALRTTEPYEDEGSLVQATTAQPQGQGAPDASHAIQLGLAELDEHHRSVIVLYYFEELDLATISDVLNVPTGTLKSRLHTAREKLKEFLRERGVGHESW